MRETERLGEAKMPKALWILTLSLLLVPLAGVASEVSPEVFGDPGIRAPAQVIRAYSDSWRRFFGTTAPLSRDLDFPPELPPEECFAKLWTLCEPALLPSERDAAHAALRMRVLGDEVPLLEPLDRLMARGRLTYADLKGPLFYRFLDETVGDEDFLPEVLPPAQTGVKLSGALKTREVTPADFNARFLAWALAKALQAGLLRASSLESPSVWALDGGAAPGAFAVASLPLPAAGGWLAFESAGDVDPRLRLVTLGADSQGALLGAALAPLPEGRSALVGGGERIWVAIINPGQSTLSLGGLALTFWGSWEPLVTLLESRLDGGSCDLLLEESPGMAAYGLWEADREGGLRPLTGEFPSGGPGTHRYRLVLEGPAPAPDALLRLVGRTATGGRVDLEFQPASETRRPEPAP